MTQKKKGLPSTPPRGEMTSSRHRSNKFLDLSKPPSRACPSHCIYPFGISPPVKKAKTSHRPSSSQGEAHQELKDEEFLIYFHTRNLKSKPITKPTQWTGIKTRTYDSIYFEPTNPSESLYKINLPVASSSSSPSKSQPHSKTSSLESLMFGGKRSIHDVSACMNTNLTEEKDNGNEVVETLMSVKSVSKAKQVLHKSGPTSLKQIETKFQLEGLTSEEQQELTCKTKFTPKPLFVGSNRDGISPVSFGKKAVKETVADQKCLVDGINVNQRRWTKSLFKKGCATGATNKALANEACVHQSDHEKRGSIECLSNVSMKTHALDGSLREAFKLRKPLVAHVRSEIRPLHRIGAFHNKRFRYRFPGNPDKDCSMKMEAKSRSEDFQIGCPEGMKQLSNSKGIAHTTFPQTIPQVCEIKLSSSSERSPSCSNVPHTLGTKHPIVHPNDPAVLSRYKVSTESLQNHQGAKDSLSGLNCVAHIGRVVSDQALKGDNSYKGMTRNLPHSSTCEVSSYNIVPKEILPLQTQGISNKEQVKEANSFFDNLPDLFDIDVTQLGDLPNGFFGLPEIPESQKKSPPISDPDASVKDAPVSQKTCLLKKRANSGPNPRRKMRE